MGIFYFVWSLDADRRLLWSSWPPGKDSNKAESFFFDLLLMSTLTSITGKELEREIKKNDSTERQRTCWNAKKMLTFLLSVLTSDWLK